MKKYFPSHQVKEVRHKVSISLTVGASGLFLILRLLKMVNTKYDWLILALLYIGDQIGEVGISFRRSSRRTKK